MSLIFGNLMPKLFLAMGRQNVELYRVEYFTVKLLEKKAKYVPFFHYDYG